MFGIGGSEAVVLIVVALLLFGSPVLTFLLGYMLGQRKANALSTDADSASIASTTATAEQHKETQPDE